MDRGNGSETEHPGVCAADVQGLVQESSSGELHRTTADSVPRHLQQFLYAGREQGGGGGAGGCGIPRDRSRRRRLLRTAVVRLWVSRGRKALLGETPCGISAVYP